MAGGIGEIITDGGEGGWVGGWVDGWVGGWARELVEFPLFLSSPPQPLEIDLV